MSAEKIVSNGFLEFIELENGWIDAITLYDEGAPGKIGCVPLSLGDLKEFHGKEVNITVELLREKAAHSILITREQLKGIEWIQDVIGYYSCPNCLQNRSQGHAEMCWLGNALAGRG